MTRLCVACNEPTQHPILCESCQRRLLPNRPARLPRCEHLTTYRRLLREAQVHVGAENSAENHVLGVLQCLVADLGLLDQEVPSSGALMTEVFRDADVKP